jgi:hypothetical protein
MHRAEQLRTDLPDKHNTDDDIRSRSKSQPNYDDGFKFLNRKSAKFIGKAAQRRQT